MAKDKSEKNIVALDELIEQNNTRETLKTIGSSLLIILVGMIVGGLVMLIGGYNPFTVFDKLITGVFGSAKYISFTIIKATPIIMTGLSVAFADRAGLFNIGAEGQFIVGTIAAALIGFVAIPAGIHPVVVLLAAAVAGGLWGGIAGALKARFGINEVISVIMLNWVALYLRNFFVSLPWVVKSPNVSKNILPTAGIDLLPNWRQSEAGKAAIDASPFLKDVFKTPVNWGIIIAIAMVVFVWFLLNKTTMGYKIKACGFNRHAAEYAGINVGANIILAMFISGALAGLAGGAQVAAVSGNISTLAAMEGYGFDGIAVALIGSSSPVGCFFAGLLFAALKYGGSKIQQPPLNAPTEIINIMIGTIVFFAAMPGLFSQIKKMMARRRKKQ